MPPADASPIEFYFDFVSPYAYLAIARAEAVAARHGRVLDWHPVLLAVTVGKVMGLKAIPQTPLKGSYARKIGDTRATSAPDRDGRFWFQVSKTF